MDRFFALLGRFPGPYWVGHALVALLILFAVALFAGLNAGALSGAAFYWGREIRDREKLGFWDWPGLAAPTLACALVFWVFRTWGGCSHWVALC